MAEQSVLVEPGRKSRERGSEAGNELNSQASGSCWEDVTPILFKASGSCWEDITLILFMNTGLLRLLGRSMSSPKGQEQSILGRAGQQGSGESGNLLMLHMVSGDLRPQSRAHQFPQHFRTPYTLNIPQGVANILPQQVSHGLLKKTQFCDFFGAAKRRCSRVPAATATAA